MLYCAQEVRRAASVAGRAADGSGDGPRTIVDLVEVGVTEREELPGATLQRTDDPGRGGVLTDGSAGTAEAGSGTGIGLIDVNEHRSLVTNGRHMLC
jgi:hypothetical protein